MNAAVLRSRNCFPEPMRQKVPPCRPLPPPSTPGRPDCKQKSKKQPSPLRKPPPRPPLRANSKASLNVTQPEEKDLTRTRRFLAMEEVRILKRGEELNPPTVPPLAPSATVPIRLVDAASAAAKSAPNATVPIELRILDFSGLYSGPGFVFSPSPSSLPFPSSLLKKPAFLGDR